jgi:hypothetical protein
MCWSARQLNFKIKNESVDISSKLTLWIHGINELVSLKHVWHAIFKFPQKKEKGVQELRKSDAEVRVIFLIFFSQGFHEFYSII